MSSAVCASIGCTGVSGERWKALRAFAPPAIAAAAAALEAEFDAVVEALEAAGAGERGDGGAEEVAPGFPERTARAEPVARGGDADPDDGGRRRRAGGEIRLVGDGAARADFVPHRAALQAGAFVADGIVDQIV
jgi:hypothetical protein